MDKFEDMDDMNSKYLFQNRFCVFFLISFILVTCNTCAWADVFDSETTGTIDSSRIPESDVVVLDTVIPQEAFIGDTLKIIEKVQNTGSTEVDIARIEYSLSPSTEGTDGQHLGWWTVMNIAPDQIISEPKILNVPAYMSPGLYYLTKKISLTALRPEKNTGNNWWISNNPIYIRYNPADPIPDLTHIKTIWPSGQPGETVQITDTVTNIGKGCADRIAVAYYLSPYQQFDPGTAYYLGVWWIDSLCGLEQKTNTTSVTIPADLTNGEYYFYSVIDPCSFLGECDEGIPELEKSNNINAGRLIIGPCVFSC